MSRKQGSRSLFDVLQTSSNFDAFLNCCTVALLARLAKVDPGWRRRVLTYWKKTWNVDVLASRYFSSGEPLWAALDGTDAIISGASAFDLFREKPSLSSSLDIFLSLKHMPKILDYLRTEGYELVQTESPSSDLGRQGSGTQVRFSLVLKRAERQVRVVIARYCPVACVLAFPCTCAMNIITAERAICIYPQATLMNSTGLLLRTHYEGVTNDEKRVQMQYKDSGVKMRRTWTPGISRIFSTGARRIGDSSCWTIEMDARGPSSGARLREQDLFRNGWSFGIVGGRKALAEHRFDYHIYLSRLPPLLELRSSAHPFWAAFARPDAEHYTFLN